jgi:hypothetical protein
MSAAHLLHLVQSGYDAPYSGTVETHGRLGLPLADHFTDLADLLGGDTRLRVWWRGAGDWRVDRLLDTGEVDLFHHQGMTTQWDSELSQARVGPDPRVRLPRDSDLLPPALARVVLTGAIGSEISRIGARRVAGHDTLGLRLRPEDPRTTIDHVDVWAEPGTGQVLAVEVYDDGSAPVVSTSFTAFSSGMPSSWVTRFHPAPGIRQSFAPVLDIADAANQYAPLAPPDMVAGLRRTGDPLGAVGTYGSGVTRILVVPLQQRDAVVLLDQLAHSGAREVHEGRLLRSGPLGVLLTSTPQPFVFQWLVTGTVTDRTLERAAHDLATGTTYR